MTEPILTADQKKSIAQAKANEKARAEEVKCVVFMGPKYKGPTPVRVSIPGFGARALGRGLKTDYDPKKPAAAYGRFTAKLAAATVKHLRQSGLTVKI